MNITDEKEYLLESQTPEEYIERSLKVNISSSKKSKITVEWFKKTGFSVKDIEKARNRNDY